MFVKNTAVGKICMDFWKIWRKEKRGCFENEQNSVCCKWWSGRHYDWGFTHSEAYIIEVFTEITRAHVVHRIHLSTLQVIYLRTW